jgi:arylsulfatase A
VTSPVTTPTPTPTVAADLGPPNFVVILADDLGYGDLGTFGHPLIKTPNLDAMAADGMKLTSFYVPASICAPSRAALMTGRWPIRTGVFWNPPKRLNDDEITIGQALRERGYATGMVGKWHLGWEPHEFPTHKGFDSYYGIPSDESGIITFYRGDQPTKDGVGKDILVRRYTDEAIDWMKSVPKGKPFFLYLAQSSPHTPYAVAPPFAGQSAAGIYGDVIEELDFTIGRVFDALSEMGVAQNTFVIFTSDNGPVIPPGSTGPLQGAKSSVLEGGVRVPAIVRWPARIPRGSVSADPVSTLDLFPTMLALAGGNLPADRAYDGMDVTRLLTGQITTLPGPGTDGRRELLYWRSKEPVSLRSGKWKYTRPVPGPWPQVPQLFDIEADPGETTDLSKTYPDVASRLNDRIDALVR